MSNSVCTLGKQGTLRSERSVHKPKHTIKTGVCASAWRPSHRGCKVKVLCSLHDAESPKKELIDQQLVMDGAYQEKATSRKSSQVWE